MDVTGNAAIVTGAGSGLGAATARHLARAGARVAVLDLNIARAEAVAEEIGGIAVACDVRDADAAVRALNEARGHQGAARILVNCAGIGTAERIVGRGGPMVLDAFAAVIGVNLIGTFNMMRLAAAEMSQQDPLEDGERGIIVSAASVAAFEGQIGQAAYAASKGGIVALTLPAAREFAQFGIRVMTIAPGLFRTPLLETLPQDAQERLAQAIPFPKRLGAPEEFAALVETCITNRSLNGETIRLDGAMRLGVR